MADRILKIRTNNRLSMNGLFDDRDNIPAVRQDKDDQLIYTVSYDGWLQDGETISSHTITPDGITISNDSATTNTLTFTASARTDDPAEVTIQITTSLAQKYTRKLRFYGQNCED